MINEYQAFFNEDILLILLHALKIDKDMKIIILHKIIDYLIEEELTRSDMFEEDDVNFDPDHQYYDFMQDYPSD